MDALLMGEAEPPPKLANKSIVIRGRGKKLKRSVTKRFKSVKIRGRDGRAASGRGRGAADHADEEDQRLDALCRRELPLLHHHLRWSFFLFITLKPRVE